LNGHPTLVLGGDLDASSNSIAVQIASSLQIGDLVQIDSEVMVIQDSAADNLSFKVTRGAYGTSAVIHSSGSAVYSLEKKTFVMPFAKEFFGSPASGSYAYPVYLPDVRLATSELFMTNSKGNSDVARKSFTSTTSGGLRTLYGGQLTIQVEGL